MDVDQPEKGINRAYLLWGAGLVLLVVAGASIGIYSLGETQRTVPNIALILQTAAMILGLGSLLLLGWQLVLLGQQLGAANRQAACSVEQLTLTAAQLTQTAKWNKTLSYHQFFGNLVTAELSDQMRETAKKYGFDDNFTSLTAMSGTALTDVLADPQADGLISSYLDEFEEFCAAVKAGVVENGYAYGIEATRVIRAAVVFEPFIRRARSSTKYSRAYLELEDVASQWQRKRADEEEAARGLNGIQPHV